MSDEPQAQPPQMPQIPQPQSVDAFMQAFARPIAIIYQDYENEKSEVERRVMERMRALGVSVKPSSAPVAAISQPEPEFPALEATPVPVAPSVPADTAATAATKTSAEVCGACGFPHGGTGQRACRTAATWRARRAEGRCKGQKPAADIKPQMGETNGAASIPASIPASVPPLVAAFEDATDTLTARQKNYWLPRCISEGMQDPKSHTDGIFVIVLVNGDDMLHWRRGRNFTLRHDETPITRVERDGDYWVTGKERRRVGRALDKCASTRPPTPDIANMRFPVPCGASGSQEPRTEFADGSRAIRLATESGKESFYGRGGFDSHVHLVTGHLKTVPCKALETDHRAIIRCTQTGKDWSEKYLDRSL